MTVRLYFQHAPTGRIGVFLAVVRRWLAVGSLFAAAMAVSAAAGTVALLFILDLGGKS